ncbi:cytochrome c biogenesis protein CcdA [uncultured Methanolobus sp.]|uniref:cytochrome c biogenesis protein CcdA n=1 Tax=uncultured Methanolobus sp. TaxID=218300 RepID=UPI0029C8B9BC|nr:cytochrome c biogenesis protein CcdA [uncultured Methanolobus sp.]
MRKRPVHQHPATKLPLRRIAGTLILLLVLTTGIAQAGNVSVEYFYESGCLKCAQASPVIEKIVTQNPDINFSEYEIASSFSLAKQYGVNTVPAVVINKSIVINYDDYKGDTELFETLLSESIETAPPIQDIPESDIDLSNSSAIWNTDTQTPYVIFIAGLLAGFNPCLIAVMAFLASVIVSSGGSRKDMLVLVTGFCSGIFVTYMIVGFGILNTISYFHGIKEIITNLMVLLVAFLGLWHLYDAYYIKKHSKSSFKTPRSFIDLMGKAEGRNILAISFVGGSIFSLVKAPCVGAVYLMILEMLISGDDILGGTLYMALYNLGVILPILILGALLAFGLDPKKVNDYREKKRVEIRLITGIILILLALMLNFNII